MFLGYSLVLIKCSKEYVVFQQARKMCPSSNPSNKIITVGRAVHVTPPNISSLPPYNKPFFLNIRHPSVVVWLFSMIPISDKTESHFYALPGFLWKNLVFSYFPVSASLLIAPQIEQLPTPPHLWHSKSCNIYLFLDSVTVPKQIKKSNNLGMKLQFKGAFKSHSFFVKKSRKAPAWNFLLCSSYLISLFQNIPLFFYPFLLKIFLRSQVRINKIVGENGVIYHPTSPSGSRLEIHISIKLLGFYSSSLQKFCWIFYQRCKSHHGFGIFSNQWCPDTGV